MRILVVSQYFDPENFRINEVCYELSNRGHEVFVLTGIPNYPYGEIFEGYEDSKRMNEVLNGVHVYRTNCRPRKKGALNLLRNYISFVKVASKKVKELPKCDIVYVYGLSPISIAMPGIKYAKRHNVPLVINCLDLWPDSIKVMGIKENSFLFKIVKKYSQGIYNKADKILIPSPQFESYLSGVCLVPEDNIEILFNHAESDYLACTNVKVDNKIHLLFAGNIGKAQNIELLINAIYRLDPKLRQSVIVDLVGDGSHVEVLKKLIEELDLNEIFIFHGHKSIKDVMEYYNLCDACILNLDGSGSISLTIPGKLQSYMASGKPIIAAVSGSARDLIIEANCGLISSNNDVELFSDNIAKFISNPNDYKDYGDNGRKYFIDNFTLDKHVSQLENYLKGMLK